MSAYLLDANVYIEAANAYYAHDIHPAFWDYLASAAVNGDVYSLEAVYAEIAGAGDDLADWAQQRAGPPMFLDESDFAIQANYRAVANWVQGEPQHGQEHIASFLAKADGWLVAAAMTHGLTVVTHEHRIINADSRKVKIPNACDAMGVPSCDTFEMLRGLGVVFS